MNFGQNNSGIGATSSGIQTSYGLNNFLFSGATMTTPGTTASYQLPQGALVGALAGSGNMAQFMAMQQHAQGHSVNDPLAQFSSAINNSNFTSHRN